MNKICTLLPAALLCLAATLPAHAAGQIEVSYVKPDEFRDAGRTSIDRQRTMNTVTEYLKQLASELPDGQTLRVEVTDIDLAGEIRPGRALMEPRVLRDGADWPRLNLRYTLLEDSRTLKSGEARLSNQAYMFSGQMPPIDSELAYEKRMLKRWFDENIAAAPR